MTAFATRSTVTPSQIETELAREASRRLVPHAAGSLCVHIQTSDESIELPATAVRLLVSMLTEMAAGNAINVMPIHAELSTQQAADLLGVSRPFLVKQLDEDRIPYRRVGSHRRVLHDDLMRYKDVIDAKRLEALDALTEQAQQLNLGY